MEYKDRLYEVIDLSYKLFCHKIAHNSLKINNEASMQLQLSVILKQIGELYVFSQSEHFTIELEKWIDLNEATTKSPKKRARCDIWLELGMEANKVCAAIELKYFKYSQYTEATTDNRFSLLLDLKNLEQYQKKTPNLLGFEIVYTNNVNYTKAETDTHSLIKLAPYITKSVTRKLKRKNEIVDVPIELKKQYTAKWVKFSNPTQDQRGHHFLKIDLNDYKTEKAENP